jgi:hypothetical protein
MSASNAAAIRRRAANANQEDNTPKPIVNTPATKQTAKPKTVAEMVVQLNGRVNELENKMDVSGNNVSQEMLGLIQEYNMRFDIIAEEISILKDTVIKLQTYTMDVNKMLLNERIHILSDVSMSKPETIDVSTDTTSTSISSTNILSEISLDVSNTVDIHSIVNDNE